MRLFLTCVFFFCPILSFGQSQIRTGPVTTMDRVSFRLNDVKTLQDAQNTIVRLRVDTPNVAIPYSTLVPPKLCTRQGSNFECEYYIPQDIVNLLNVPGKHELYSYVFNGNCCESAPSMSWTITMPSKP
jgi:hypothetical protein